MKTQRIQINNFLKKTQHFLVFFGDNPSLSCLYYYILLWWVNFILVYEPQKNSDDWCLVLDSWNLYVAVHVFKLQLQFPIVLLIYPNNTQDPNKA